MNPNRIVLHVEFQQAIAGGFVFFAPRWAFEGM
jgi:hypothetical protein